MVNYMIIHSRGKCAQGSFVPRTQEQFPAVQALVLLEYRLCGHSYSVYLFGV
jgi:hypothetical protein